MQKLFGFANRLLQQLSGWLVSDDIGGEDSGCGDPGPVGYTAKFSEMPLDTAYGQYFDI